MEHKDRASACLKELAQQVLKPKNEIEVEKTTRLEKEQKLPADAREATKSWLSWLQAITAKAKHAGLSSFLEEDGDVYYFPEINEETIGELGAAVVQQIQRAQQIDPKNDAATIRNHYLHAFNTLSSCTVTLLLQNVDKKIADRVPVLLQAYAQRPDYPYKIFLWLQEQYGQVTDREVFACVKEYVNVVAAPDESMVDYVARAQESYVRANNHLKHHNHRQAESPPTNTSARYLQEGTRTLGTAQQKCTTLV
jgi:hypothetical protein